jgi:AraC-like DNA-binding protein
VPAKPTYRSRRRSYEIDRCEPQNRALESGKIQFCALTKGHYPGRRIPAKVLPGLSSIGFWDAGGHPDWGLDPHRNEGIEIMFLETGSMPFRTDRKQFDLRAGSFTVTRPWQLHQLGAPHIGPGRLHWLILDVGVRRPHQTWHWPDWIVLARNDLAELTRSLRRQENTVWSATPAVVEAFRGLSRAVVDWDRSHAVSHLVVHINLLLVGILAALGEQHRSGERRLVPHQQRVGNFLQDLESGRIHPGDPWTLGKMAAACDMGVTTFSKYCREQVNAGPVEYLNHCRLERAARRLRMERHVPVTEIALGSGFNSSQYFATLFVKRYGLSPTQYRLKR